MTNIQLSFAELTDLDDIMTVETSCFTADEASSRASMLERIEKNADTFIVARDMDKNGQVIGMIVGPTSSNRYITDDLFVRSEKNKASDKFQTVTSLAVLKEYRKHKIASRLIKKLIEVSKASNRELISLTCLKFLIPYYEKQGFTNEGRSESQLAGEVWYNMTYQL